MKLALPAVALLVAAFAAPASSAEIDCEMRFSMKGWSAFYKTSSGTGTIRCNNGQTLNVKLRAKGGGITFGKSSIENGVGEFSGVNNANELLGTYVAGEAHAGAAKSAKAQVMTKGEVNLALSGKGRGWDLGIAFGKFVIERR
jgi:hypothetical protein